MAWLAEIELLKRELTGVTEGWLALEFAIPRMGRRADAVIIWRGVIFVLEFKIGAHDFDSAAIDQAVDYCLDLKNFHEGSHVRPLVPIVVATKAVTRPGQLPFWPDEVAKPILTNGTGLAKAMELEASRFPAREEIDASRWLASSYPNAIWRALPITHLSFSQKQNWVSQAAPECRCRKHASGLFRHLCIGDAPGCSHAQALGGPPGQLVPKDGGPAKQGGRRKYGAGGRT